MSYKHSNPRWWRDAEDERAAWMEAQAELHRIARERLQAELDAEIGTFIRRVAVLVPALFIVLVVFATVVMVRGCDRPSTPTPSPCAEQAP